MHFKKFSISFPSFALFSLGLLLGAALFASGSAALAAYAPPPGSPTTCPTGYQGCDAPLNVSTALQTKLGNLIIGSGALGIGLVTSGFYGDATNLAARTPSPSGATYFQDQGGARTWAAVGSPFNGVYSYANMNANDYYIRAIGKWASQLGGTTVNENRFGGMYSVGPGSSSNADNNIYTGAKSCPAWAPNVARLARVVFEIDSIGSYDAKALYGSLYYCYKP